MQFNQIKRQKTDDIESICSFFLCVCVLMLDAHFDKNVFCFNVQPRAIKQALAFALSSSTSKACVLFLRWGNCVGGEKPNGKMKEKGGTHRPGASFFFFFVGEFKSSSVIYSKFGGGIFVLFSALGRNLRKTKERAEVRERGIAQTERAAVDVRVVASTTLSHTTHRFAQGAR